MILSQNAFEPQEGVNPSTEEQEMTKVTYKIVEHDGGWAYRVDEVFSETFKSHDAARQAAERAAKEQVVAGSTRPSNTKTGKVIGTRNCQRAMTDPRLR